MVRVGGTEHWGLVTSLHQQWLGARVVVERREDEFGDVGGGRVQVVDKGDQGALGHWLQRGDDRGRGDDSGVDRKAMMNMDGMVTMM